MKKIFALMLALCFVLTGCVINTSPENDDEAEESEEIEENTYTSDNKTYKIGFSGPLTGAAAIYGEAIRNAAQMAVDEINENGGLDGVKFELIATDDKHDPTNVATNFSSMLEKGMQVSLGTVTTSPGLEFKYLAEKENLFFLTPSASGDDIPNGDNGYQMCFADGNLGKVAASYVNENCKDEKVGIFYKSDDPYSKGIYDQFMANLDKSINPVITSFTKANETDFNTQIDTLSDCTFIFMPIYYTPASVFMKQAKEEVAADAVYYGCDGFDGIDNIKGFDINSIPQEISMLSHFNSKAEYGMAADFVKKYTEIYGKETLNQFGASAYDCVYAIYYAMKEAKDDGENISVTISASDLCDILKDRFSNGFTLENGVTGENISWFEDGYVNKDGIKFVIKEKN